MRKILLGGRGGFLSCISFLNRLVKSRESLSSDNRDKYHLEMLTEQGPQVKRTLEFRPPGTNCYHKSRFPIKNDRQFPALLPCHLADTACYSTFQSLQSEINFFIVYCCM